MCHTSRSSNERVLCDWVKWMEQTGMKQTMWESWVGRTQPEKHWHGLKLNLSLRICTFFDSLQLSFQERERRMCGLYQIRFEERKNGEGDTMESRGKRLILTSSCFFLWDEMRQLVYAVLAVSWTAFFSTPFALDSVQISSIWFPILIEQPHKSRIQREGCLAASHSARARNHLVDCKSGKVKLDHGPWNLALIRCKWVMYNKTRSKYKTQIWLI